MKKVRIAVVAPSSHFSKTLKNFKEGVKTLKKSGANVVYTKAIFKKYTTFAGTPEERFKDLLSAIKNSDNNIIMFPRGGYGVAQLLPMLDKKNISKYIKNKRIIGNSDITALFCFLYTKYKKVCSYGPNIASPYLKRKSILDNIIGETTSIKPIKIKYLRKTNNKTIEGLFFGGCLSVMTSLVGTKYIKPLDGHILFIEDVNEPPYKIDRMLTQLLQSGIIKNIKAIAVGAMEKCDTPPYTWKDPVMRIAKMLDVPVIYGINAGHGGFDLVLPLGAKAVIKRDHLYLK